MWLAKDGLPAKCGLFAKCGLLAKDGLPRTAKAANVAADSIIHFLFCCKYK